MVQHAWGPQRAQERLRACAYAWCARVPLQEIVASAPANVPSQNREVACIQNFSACELAPTPDV